MSRRLVINSVVTRLLACLIVGGLTLSAGLTWLELRRSESQLRLKLAQQVAVNTRSLHSLLHELLDGKATAQEIRQALDAHSIEGPICGIRVTGASLEPIIMGDWSAAPASPATLVTLPEHGGGAAPMLRLGRRSMIRAPMVYDGRQVELDLLLDGPAALQRMRSDVLAEMTGQWLLLGVMTALGLFLMRRWFTGPLSKVVELVHGAAGAPQFNAHARTAPGEFAQLSEAIGGMLSRLDDTTERLRQREAAFANLYQFAPSAMIGVDPAGQIVGANRRAMALLAAANEDELVGRAVTDFIDPDDRALWRQTMSRLDMDNAARCELRVIVNERTIHAVVEAVVFRDKDGAPRHMRVSMLDVSRSKQLQRQLADKSQLLNLIIDHMSDAILLVDAQNRIAAHNQQLATLLGRRLDALTGEQYDPERFWSDLGVLNEQLFFSRLRQIEAERDRPAQERIETRVGTFLFQGIPVQETDGQVVGRLWVVQEITAQEQAQRLLRQQANQLQAVKRLCHSLCDVREVDHLLLRAAEMLYEVFDLEAVGIAIRRDAGPGRSQQILHRGSGAYLLTPNKALVEVIERQLMPQVLSTQDVSHWQEMAEDLPWSRSMMQAGLTCLAGVPLKASSDAQGILWIARRGGEQIGRHHIYLLEALAPVIAARLESAHIRQCMYRLELTDPVTDLPNRQFFDDHVRKLAGRAGESWCVLMVGLDRFGRLSEALNGDMIDRLRKMVAVTIQSVCRKSTFIGSVATGTFAVVAAKVDRKNAIALAERVRSSIAAQTLPLPDEKQLQVSASVGLAYSPDDGADGASLTDLALARMENARRAGGDRIDADGTAVDRMAG